jgi:uncharacterized protein
MIIVLAALFALVGCKGGNPQTKAGDKAKIDSISVVRPDLEGAAAPYVQEGMAYREERDAAAQGDPATQYALGLKYETGAGVKQDFQEAVKWYRLAAERGNAIAQNALGSCYDYGKGVTSDPAQALKWYKASAQQGYAAAQFNLASLYYQGKGVERDYLSAAKWYRLAADQGLATAQYILGARYFDGEGVPQDYREAYYWVLLAMANGSDDLRGMRDYASEQLTAQQKSETQARANKWLAEHKQL